MPLLLQRTIGLESRPIPIDGIRTLIRGVLATTELTEASGQPLEFSPHDFRRILSA